MNYIPLLLAQHPVRAFMVLNGGRTGRGSFPALRLLLEGCAMFRLQADLEPYLDRIAFLEAFRFLDEHFYGHKVLAVLREQGR